MTDPERRRSAAIVDRNALHVGLAAVCLATLGVADLITGALIDDRRLDAGLLIAAALAAYGGAAMHRSAERLRRGDPRPDITREAVVKAYALVVTAVVAAIIIGYLVGGLAGAVAVPAVSVVPAVPAVFFGRRKAGRCLTPDGVRHPGERHGVGLTGWVLAACFATASSLPSITA